MTNATAASLDEVDLWDLVRFARGEEHAMFECLRREAPVWWHDRPGGEPFWAVTGYAEARSILCEPATFSSATVRGGMFLRGAQASAVGLPEGVGGPMIETDPPRHQPQRRVLSPTFTPRAVATLEVDIRAVTTACLDRVEELGRFDFVTEVAHVIPSEVTLSLLGVPRADWARLADLEHRALTSADPDYTVGDSGVATMDDALLALGLYFFELLSEKERTGGDDLLCHLLATPVEGSPRSVVDLVGEAILLVNGGLDTTRAAASAGGMLPLLEQADRQARLRENPELLATAVDEFVRWASPIRHVARTATADAAVGGATIREGDRIGIWLGACNRDGSVFAAPDVFDLAREPNPHLGFAFGQHFLLGHTPGPPDPARRVRRAPGPLLEHRAGRSAPGRVVQLRRRSETSPRGGLAMTQLESGGVCVVTGAASGIGRALAGAFGSEGMRVVLADVNEQLLAEAVAELSASGIECIAHMTDVRDPSSVERLAEVAVERFGGVNVVCNNAGVSTMGKQWEISAGDWDWVIGVCLGGVVNGVRSFVPRMLAQGGPAHVVNTASMGGLLTGAYIGPYVAAKHGVVGLSKGLRAELEGTGIGVSVVCPGMVSTPILGGIRAHMEAVGAGGGEEVEFMFEVLESGLQTGMPAEDAAAMVLAAVKADQFWVLPNGADYLPSVQADFDEMLVSAAGPETELA